MSFLKVGEGGGEVGSGGTEKSGSRRDSRVKVLREKRVVNRKFTQPCPPAPRLRAQAYWIVALILFVHGARFYINNEL